MKYRLKYQNKFSFFVRNKYINRTNVWYNWVTYKRTSCSVNLKNVSMHMKGGICGDK